MYAIIYAINNTEDKKCNVKFTYRYQHLYTYTPRCRGVLYVFIQDSSVQSKHSVELKMAVP